MSTEKALVKSAGVVSLGTNLSRILGLVRDIVIARFFGITMATQAFVVAFRIPNLLRDLVGEGAANAAFVPVLTEYLTTRSKEEFWKVAHCLLVLLFLILLVVSIIGVLLAPVIVRIIAPGFVKYPEKLDLTVRLTRLIFPYIFFIGLFAYLVGLLNSLRHFAVPAFSYSLLNLSLIVCVLVLYQRLKEPTIALAIGVLIGGALQLFAQIPVLYKKGMRNLSGYLNLWHPAVKRIGALLLPRAFGAGVYQLSIFIGTVLASLGHIVGKDAVAVLYFASRIQQYPLAIFGISFATAALPTMSSQAAKKDMASLKKTLSFSLRSVFFITVPAQIGLMSLSCPIVKLLFQRGKFDAYSTSATSGVLFYCLIGLFAFAGIKILVSCFYSLQDTLTPVKVASLSLALHIILALLLMWPLKIKGLALATSLAGIFNFLVLFIILRTRLTGLDVKGISTSFLKVVTASGLMGLACFSLWNKLNLVLPGETLFIESMRLLITIVTGIVIYLLFTFSLRSQELRMVTKWISRRS